MANFKKNVISTEIDKVINNGFSIDVSGDEAALSNSNYNWDDLNKLKDDLGHSVLEFIGQVNAIITNPQITNSLGDKRPHFEQLVSLFFSDINTFSNKIKDLRVQHEHQYGKVNDINEFDHYNRLAFQYHGLYSELTTLITPTLSELVLTITEITDQANSQNASIAQ